MSAEKIFNKLRQQPVEDVLKAISEIPRMPAAYQLGGSTYQLYNLYPEISIHNDRIKVINDNGWEYEDFMLALEKRSALIAINEFNKELIFPQEIIDRAKKHFPNIKFTMARIDFE